MRSKRVSTGKIILGFVGIFSITGIIGFLKKDGLEALRTIKNVAVHMLPA
jgi:hypothetical protein